MRELGDYEGVGGAVGQDLVAETGVVREPGLDVFPCFLRDQVGCCLP